MLLRKTLDKDQREDQQDRCNQITSLNLSVINNDSAHKKKKMIQLTKFKFLSGDYIFPS